MVTPTSTGITTTPLPVPSCHVKAERQRRRLVNRYTRKHERLAKRLRESLPPIPKLYVVPPETVEPVPPLPPPKSMGNRGEPVYAVPARVNVAGPSMASARRQRRRYQCIQRRYVEEVRKFCWRGTLCVVFDFCFGHVYGCIFMFANCIFFFLSYVLFSYATYLQIHNCPFSSCKNSFSKYIPTR
ncbi:hypothetical protein BC829DRAFT_26884 [Chytridium lagenaria]|nr:hypothetical protein BC829DRAFT_26884 [Chytridium lagenaria]